MQIRIKDLYWAAGFLEGEGCFSPGGWNKYPRIGATQVEKAPLLKLQELFGGTVYLRIRKSSAISKKPIHDWRLIGKPAVGVMMTIYGLLSPARQNTIKASIAHWKTIPNGSGEKHRLVAVNDEKAIVVLQRIANGETMTAVAKDVGVTRHTIGNWVSGRKRRYLSGNIPEARRALRPNLRGTLLSDEEVLEAMRRVDAGESRRDVANSLGVSEMTVGTWMRGEHRPDLLTRLKKEN